MPPKETKARRALLDSAMILLAINPGATFIEIAENAGIGRATLYRHFPTREDLIRTLSLEAINAIDDVVEAATRDIEDPVEILRLSLKVIIPLGDRYYFLIRLPETNDEEINRHLHRQDQELEYLIRHAQRIGKIDPNTPSTWLCSIYNAIFYAAWEQIHKGILVKEDIIKLAVQSFNKILLYDHCI